MGKFMQKWICVLLAAIMVFGMIPSARMYAHAETLSEDENAAEAADRSDDEITGEAGPSEGPVVPADDREAAEAETEEAFFSGEPAAEDTEETVSDTQEEDTAEETAFEEDPFEEVAAPFGEAEAAGPENEERMPDDQDAVMKGKGPSTTYEVWVSGIQVSSDNLEDVLGDGTGSVKFDPSTNTLTLKNPTINGIRSGAIVYAAQLDLTITGNAVLKHAEADYGILVYDGALTISGNISVEVTANTSVAIRADKDIAINGGTLNLSGDMYGILSQRGNINISAGNITACGRSMAGVFAYGNLRITGGTVNATSEWYGAVGSGLHSDYGDILIEGGDITASGFFRGISNIYGDITISGGTVRATATGDYNERSGIECQYDRRITISGGTVIAEGKTNGLRAYSGDITISGGTVTAKGNNYGICVKPKEAEKGGNIIFSGEDTIVTAKGGKSAVLLTDSDNASITITSPLGIVTPVSGMEKDGKIYKADGETVATDAVIRRVCKVTFNANGHGTAPEPQCVAYNTAAKEPSGITAEGYTFDGWYTDAACTNKYDFSTPVTADITLYAKWLADVKVMFDVQGRGAAPETQQIKYGGAAAEPSEPSAEGYTFDGWHTEAACTNKYDFSTPVTADITLYAKWLADVKVMFDVQGHGTAPETQQIKYGGAAAEPSGPSEEGYTFGGWYTEAACTTEYDFSTALTGDITLYAKWLVNVNGLKLHADGTALNGIYYRLNADTLEAVFEKDSGTVEIELGDLCTDSACSNVLTTEPEKGKTYYFLVYMKDPSSYDSGKQLVMFLPGIADNIDAAAEEAVIEFDWISGSPNGDAVTLQFKYTEELITYTVSKGADAAWTKGSSSGVDYTVNRNIHDDKTYSLFESIEVDGAVIAASNYTAASGSLNATLKASWLKTLSEGKHTLKFNFKDGSAETKLTVKSAPAPSNSNAPRTGDPNSLGLWIGAAAVSLLGLAWLLIKLRKRSK